jgi:hypothetical protein
MEIYDYLACRAELSCAGKYDREDEPRNVRRSGGWWEAASTILRATDRKGPLEHTTSTPLIELYDSPVVLSMGSSLRRTILHMSTSCSSCTCGGGTTPFFSAFDRLHHMDRFETKVAHTTDAGKIGFMIFPVEI